MAAAFSSTLYMYDAILSTFGSENKLCRVVSCKSGMAVLNALVCGQFRSMCSSVWRSLHILFTNLSISVSQISNLVVLLLSLLYLISIIS